MNETANDKLSINTILSRLEKAVDEIKIKKIQWALNDLIFNFCTGEQFKMAANDVLTNITS